MVQRHPNYNLEFFHYGLNLIKEKCMSFRRCAFQTNASYNFSLIYAKSNAMRSHAGKCNAQLHTEDAAFVYKLEYIDAPYITHTLYHILFIDVH